MKSATRRAALACGIFMLGGAVHAAQIQDNLAEPVALNVGDTMSGQFVVDTSVIDLNKVNGATIAITLADDGEKGSATTGELNINNNTSTYTYNGVRTVTLTVTKPAYFLDEEMESVQIQFGNQTKDATIQGGTVSYLGEETVEGPIPVPVEDCGNTFGFYTSCQNIYITRIIYNLSGYTGENIVYVQLDNEALQIFKQTGTLDYNVTGTLGDLSVKNAVLDVSVVTSPVSFSDYEPTSLDGMKSVGALNNNGVVVGQMDAAATADGWPHAAMWQSGALTDLGMAGCRDTVSFCWSDANGINDQGQIVGESFTDLSWPSPYFGPWSMYYAHEAMWQDANTPLAFMRALGWEYGRTLDINAQGHAVGHGRSVDWQVANGDYMVHGFLWRSNADVVEFGDYGGESKAFALNDSDQVVGETSANGATQAFIWDNGVTTILGHLGGGQSTAVDINNDGKVVGSALNLAGQWRAFMWQGGFLYALQALPDTVTSRALAINDSGLIVGEMDGRAVAWQGGQLVELNDYVDASFGLNLVSAVAVNNQGQIVAKAADDSYHLLTIVVPPPPSDVTVCPEGCDYSSIQDGIDAAGSGHTVLVLDGNYNEMITIPGNVTVISWKGPSKTIIDATGLGGSTVTLNGGTIEGFTIMGGTGVYGGGINMRSGTVQNNVVTGNSASSDGGGIYVGSRYSNAVIHNNTISNNDSARNGGGIAHASYTTVNMRNNTFSGNHAVYGGAAYLGAYATLTFADNIVRANSANYGGGVFLGSYTSGRVVNSLITENTASLGGGVCGGAYTGGQVVNSTIVNNSDGIGAFSYSSPLVVNSIIWGNAGAEVSTRARVSYSIVAGGFVGDGNLDADPLFVNAAAGDYHLMSGSPAIDAGSDVSAFAETAADFDGNARPADGDGLGAGATGDGSDYDIGAYEYQ